MKPEGIFKNGDIWYNETCIEDGRTYFYAYHPQTNQENGPDYETTETPERFPILSLTIFPDGTKESEAQQYFLQKNMGDMRFGSTCEHARTKNGYCPDCLRKVL